jgi:hypothetical protein
MKRLLKTGPQVFGDGDFVSHDLLGRSMRSDFAVFDEITSIGNFERLAHVANFQHCTLATICIGHTVSLLTSPPALWQVSGLTRRNPPLGPAHRPG